MVHVYATAIYHKVKSHYKLFRQIRYIHVYTLYHNVSECIHFLLYSWEYIKVVNYLQINNIIIYVNPQFLSSMIFFQCPLSVFFIIFLVWVKNLGMINTNNIYKIYLLSHSVLLTDIQRFIWDCHMTSMWYSPYWYLLVRIAVQNLHEPVIVVDDSWVTWLYIHM